ncbi:MAG: glycosyltransferase [Dysgonamonadaceae bacterium]|nr:glycosyltransferase [Dysgonamonadaceae bacterium]
MKASLIISVYKNVPFLKAVLDSLKFQTVKDFEIIISEDGNDIKMKSFIENYPFEQPYQHIWQEDLGWRKNKCLNNAIKAAKADWLIFIDGDCILHERFIEMHLLYAKEDVILAGKRVKLDEPSSLFLLENSSHLLRMQQKLKRKLIFGKGETAFLEEGFFISPKGFLWFIPRFRRNNRLLGCNMSFSKKAIYAINGFDEDYILPAVGEDADLTWRFKAVGYHLFSLRNLAIVYHLNHPTSWISQDENLIKYHDKINKNEFVCKNGLLKML